jgi:phage baseplate assembly protein W
VCIIGAYVFTDFAFDLRKNEFKDLETLEDVDSVKQSMRAILMTRRGSRPMNPLFGSDVHKILFEKINNATSILLRNEIQRSITTWDPRIEILDIVVNTDEDNNAYMVDIYFRLKNLGIQDVLTVTLVALL